jgi:hypothetical protein
MTHFKAEIRGEKNKKNLSHFGQIITNLHVENYLTLLMNNVILYKWTLLSKKASANLYLCNIPT